MADMLSQEEINALLGGMDTDFDDENENGDADAMITSEQIDVLGEIGNISMGTSATTLFALLGQKVQITTPKVSVIKWANVQNKYDRPCVGIRVNYISGIEGTNVLLLKHNDVKVITSLMIGLGGEVEKGDDEINEMDLSAISEAMNQMIGSASTSLASLIKEKIDIDTPVAFVVDFATHEKLDNLPFGGEYAVCVQFRMQIGSLIDSDIMQLLPIEFAQNLTEKVKSFISEPIEQPARAQAARVAPGKVEENMATCSFTQAQSNTQPQGGAAPMQYAPPGSGYAQPIQSVAANPAQFQNFDITDIAQQKENIEIIMDVPLEVTVELGRTAKKIREILEFSPGSIIELNKLAGEPIDILVNGKFVANGEVVVIDENFGIRVTNIINAEYRI
jgi:flagellar motor switch protein FliN/FliY